MSVGHPLTPQLWRAYLDSRYTVLGPDGPIELLIGQPPPPGLQPPFALITAWNPYSQRLDEDSNRQRQLALMGALIQQGRRFLPARGEGADGWYEDSVLILDISLADAKSLANRFEQHAILWGDQKRINICKIDYK